MSIEPYIRARWTTAERDGGCAACGERLLRVKNIQVGNTSFTQSFRLCDRCIKALIAELKKKGQ